MHLQAALRLTNLRRIDSRLTAALHSALYTCVDGLTQSRNVHRATAVRKLRSVLVISALGSLITRTSRHVEGKVFAICLRPSGFRLLVPPFSLESYFSLRNARTRQAVNAPDRT